MRATIALFLAFTACATESAAPPRLVMVPIRDETPQPVQLVAMLATEVPSGAPPTSLLPPDLVPDVAPNVTIDESPQEVWLVEGIGRAEMPGGSIASSFQSPYVTHDPNIDNFVPHRHIGFHRYGSR